MDRPPSVGVVVVAAGEGRRLGCSGPKALVQVRGRPLLLWSLDDLEHSPCVGVVVVVAPPSSVNEFAELAAAAGATKVVATVAGGDTRQLSVAAGLAAIPAGPSHVAVHDAARPFAGPQLLDRLLAELTVTDAAGIVPSLPVTDTVRRVGPDGSSLGVVDRASLRTMQTPQLFVRAALEQAHAHARAHALAATDDAALVEQVGLRVRLAEGPARNLKVTTALDVALAEVLARGEEQP